MSDAKKKKEFKAYVFNKRKCPKCGGNLASHPERYGCGKCGYMEKKG
ncbi:MAG: 30S ribosomal protein S27ae [Candidatus Micrarchaeota archaeon]